MCDAHQAARTELASVEGRLRAEFDAILLSERQLLQDAKVATMHLYGPDDSKNECMTLKSQNADLHNRIESLLAVSDNNTALAQKLSAHEAALQLKSEVGLSVISIHHIAGAVSCSLRAHIASELSRGPAGCHLSVCC